jgi:hypothetical protein
VSGAAPVRRTGAGAGLALAALVYLVLAVVLWWGVWSTNPGVTTTCGCGDAARFLWFFEWPSYAMTHGHSLWYSSYLFHPTGINLLDDTSVLALGVVLSPVTLAFGPVAGMNVALTLAPALSALAMFVLLRRWVRWTPAAFVGGLAYGFSPFLISELALNQLNIAMVAVPPLVALVLDELLVRRRRSPVWTGVLLAVLVVVQFFVSTEVLLITVVFAGIAVGAVALVAVTRHRAEFAGAVRYAATGLGTAAAVSVVVLAYPLWYLLRGPAHLTGPIWSNGGLSHYGNSLTAFWLPGTLVVPGHRFGGYQGPALPGLGYLGAGVVVVAVVGTVVGWRDRRLLLFAGLGVVAAALSLGPGHGLWVPWQIVDHLPWIGDIVEVRFTLVLTLCAAVILALVVDRVYGWAADRAPAASGPRSATVASWVAGALAVAALLPSAVVVAPNVPITTRAVVLPGWFTEVGAVLPPGRVVLAYPVPFSGLQSSEAWQAVNRMRWAQAGGGGPEGQASRAGAARAGFAVLLQASLPIGPPPALTPTARRAVRRTLGLWRVTTIVVPDQGDLPDYEEGRGAAYAVGFFTTVTGRSPVLEHSAWVWTLAPPPAAVSG